MRARIYTKLVAARASDDLHKVSLEEFLQFPLTCRIGQIANVESTALGSAGEDSIIIRGRLGLVGLFVDGGIAQSIGNVMNGVIDLLHSGRHFRR